MMLSIALDNGVPCVIYDLNDKKYPVTSPTVKIPHHKVASNVITYSYMSTGQLSVVNTIEEVKERMYLLIGQC